MSHSLKYGLFIIVGCFLGWGVAFIQYSKQPDSNELNVESTVSEVNLSTNNESIQTDLRMNNCAKQELSSLIPAKKADKVVIVNQPQRVNVANYIRENATLSETEYWQSRLYQSDDLEEKLTSIEELTFLNNSIALAIGLGNPSISVRNATVEGLQQIGDSDSVRLLAQSLYSEPDVNQRIKVIHILENFNYDPLANIFIRRAMEQDKSAVVREAAARVLGEDLIEH